MASKLKKIFLSASIPLADRDPKYFDTADNTAIRDAVIALSRIVLPKAELVWGGHPSITPLIRAVLEKQKLQISEHVTLYQSNFFLKKFPSDNKFFEKLIITDELKDQEESLGLMRKKMIVENNFCAAIFIGGMDGVENEYKLFKEAHPDVPVFPIASTGAASRILYFQEKFTNERLLTDFCYLPLFDELFEEILNGE
ncbi:MULTISPECIES: hypothetical protein [Acinetobacter calcoaceticus/baumannii complex]|uniref:SLOG domain-containing protein n=1 Tax=Acinetobacter calcoaceticus/baumannii complex TaxID=909768 RepID=UPI00044F90BB|nr:MULTISPECIES: hypothetical protein [Acinetobacter calcoaceticus/baumannii complex]AOM85634.1 hypothetical protein AN158_05085 [Acinetobacter baumannii]EXS32816.1 hypothetical protein J663_3164 [Acinetobacter sp. 826659]MBJ9937124.1 hypothetical protein [Acinetobacter pittii]